VGEVENKSRKKQVKKAGGPGGGRLSARPGGMSNWEKFWSWKKSPPEGGWAWKNKGGGGGRPGGLVKSERPADMGKTKCLEGRNRRRRKTSKGKGANGDG